jgi:hypothetical protein
MSSIINFYYKDIWTLFYLNSQRFFGWSGLAFLPPLTPDSGLLVSESIKPSSPRLVNNSKSKRRGTESKTRYYPTIDILSIGSLSRPDYQVAQERTFGSHASVRTFWAVNEHNESSSTHCTKLLTMDTVHRILHYCGRLPKPFSVLDGIKQLYTD